MKFAPLLGRTGVGFNFTSFRSIVTNFKFTFELFYISQLKLINQILYEPSGPWSGRLSPVCVVLSGWESLTPPGWDTNPSQVSSQQMMVLIYLPWKDGKLSWLRRERKSHKSVQTSAKPGIELGTLWSKGRDLTNCANHARP